MYTRYVAAEADIDALLQGRGAAKTASLKWQFDSRRDAGNSVAISKHLLRNISKRSLRGYDRRESAFMAKSSR